MNIVLKKVESPVQNHQAHPITDKEIEKGLKDGTLYHHGGHIYEEIKVIEPADEKDPGDDNDPEDTKDPDAGSQTYETKVLKPAKPASAKKPRGRPRKNKPADKK